MNEQLLNIANMVSLDLQEGKEVTLIGGKLGATLFYYELSGYTGIKMYNEIADDLLGEVMDGIQEIKDNSMNQGFSGIGWGINYLIRNEFVEADSDTLADIEYHIFSKESINFHTGFSLLSPALYLLSRPECILNDCVDRVSTLLNTCSYYCLSIYDDKKKPLDLINSMLYFLIELKKRNIYIEKTSRLIWRILNYLLNYQVSGDMSGDSAILFNLLQQMDDSSTLKEKVLIKLKNAGQKDWSMKAYGKILWQQILFSQYKEDLIIPDVNKMLSLAGDGDPIVKKLMIPLGLYLMNKYKSK